MRGAREEFEDRRLFRRRRARLGVAGKDTCKQDNRKCAAEADVESFEKHLIIASDHNQGVFLMLNTSEEWDIDSALGKMRKFVALPAA